MIRRSRTQKQNARTLGAGSPFSFLTVEGGLSTRPRLFEAFGASGTDFPFFLEEEEAARRGAGGESVKGINIVVGAPLKEKIREPEGAPDALLFFFFLPTRVSKGGSHFFFCSSFFWFWSPGRCPPGPPGAPGSPDGVFP